MDQSEKTKQEGEAGIEVPVVNSEGQEVDRVRFEASRLDRRQRNPLLKEAVVMYLANRRQGTHDTKTRSEVNFSNKKPWRQKGTGRARAGTRRSPLWRKGGIIFGPHPRDYSYAINKKQRRLALRSALYCKFRDGEVRVVDRIEISGPKTRQVAAVLRSLGIEGSCLVGIESYDRNLLLAARNLPGVRLLPIGDFNALEVLNARTILLTRAALDRLISTSKIPDVPDEAKA